ncbi:MAG: DUF502 domain-containing protein [Pirellulaceae bacterium]|nr:DUF502 domain-containing protein [Pirellulaceae bacterium]
MSRKKQKKLKAAILANKQRNDSKGERGMKAAWGLIKTRILQGLIFVLPLAITYWIIAWCYQLLRDLVITPVSYFVVWVLDKTPQEEVVDDSEKVADTGATELFGDFSWYEHLLVPGLAIIVVFIILYACGMVFRSKVHLIMDWFVHRVPVINSIYNAVKKVFDSLYSSSDTSKFQRVVLVPFPTPEMKCPAFVTNTIHDTNTREKIYCVYVPTTPVPTSGYMLMLPASEVIDVDWDVNETLQAIVSGGIVVPGTINYFPTTKAEPGKGAPSDS